MDDVVARSPSHGPRARPRLHFTPPRGWLNDPNGLITWRDRHHLFYQHNPNGIEHGDIHWGHAISEDLLEWRHLPEALAPDPDGPDRDGCFSGDAIVHDGAPALVYSGNRGGHQLPCLAFAIDPDELTTWTKYPGNPVISAPPAGFGRDGFRDHCVWREDGGYYQLIASSTDDGRGAVLLYRSTDLAGWEYLGPLLVSPDDSLGRMWECPDFFPLGDSWVLLVSMIGGVWDRSVAYFTGDYSDRTFHPRVRGRLDWGSRFYAPQTFLDRDGRRVVLGWLHERTSEVEGSDWCGWMSLPRVLTLADHGLLRSQPLPALAGRRRRVYEPPVVAGGRVSLPDIEDPLEIEMTWPSGPAPGRGCGLRYRDPAAPSVTVRWDAVEGGVRIEVDGTAKAAHPPYDSFWTVAPSKPMPAAPRPRSWCTFRTPAWARSICPLRPTGPLQLSGSGTWAIPIRPPLCGVSRGPCRRGSRRGTGAGLPAGTPSARTCRRARSRRGRPAPPRGRPAPGPGAAWPAAPG